MNLWGPYSFAPIPLPVRDQRPSHRSGPLGATLSLIQEHSHAGIACGRAGELTVPANPEL
jgi:hypothetical protein